MLINALCEYYDILFEKGEVVEDGFSKQNVSYMIFLTAEGMISGIENICRTVTEKTKAGKEKNNLLPIEVSLPYREPSTIIKAYRIDHRGRYIFGLNYDKEKDLLTFADDKNAARKSHEKFIEENVAFIADIHSPIIDAFRNFMERWTPENETENKYLTDIRKEFSAVGFCFALDGHPEITLHKDALILSKVRADCGKLEPDNEVKEGICAVSGKREPIARIHNKVKGIKGQKTGTFVCVNNLAEESYTKKQGDNSQISESTMKKYTDAFNVLSADIRHKAYVDDMTVIFWSLSRDKDEESDIFSASAFDSKATPEKISKAINQAMKYTRTGVIFDSSALDVDENVDFYIAGFMPNNSRVSQKFIYHNKFGRIFENVIQHQKDLYIPRIERLMSDNGDQIKETIDSDDSEKTVEQETQISVNRIAHELVSPKASNAAVSPVLSSQLFHSIITGANYPVSLLENVIRRVKTDEDDDKKKFYKINRVRIGIIKAYLNRKTRLSGGKEEIKLAIDFENTHPAYLCGRLFAVLEKVQKEAAPKLNKTIKDAYFASACAKPSTVFPKLLKLSQFHMAKIRDEKTGSYIFSDKLTGEIFSKLGTEFPSTLSLEDQGRFIIGYYQQHQDFFNVKTQN